MKAILVTCPHCGARVQVEGASDTTRCDYCGTVARVQRRTRMFQTVMPAPPSQGRPAAIAVQHRNKAMIPILVLTILAPIVVSGVIFAMVNRTVNQATRSVAKANATYARAANAPEWQGTHGALVVDVNRDGTPDLIGRSRRVSAGDDVRVIAIDGRNGKPLWESSTVGTYSDTSQGTLALAGDLAVFTTPRAKLFALEFTTGATRWTTTLDERVARFCRDDNDPTSIVAIGTDHVERRVRRTDGTVTTAPAEREPPAKKRRARAAAPPCEELVSDARRSPARQDLWTLGRKHDVDAEFLLEGEGVRVIAGRRATGTRVPTLVVLDAAGTARWRTDVPADRLGSLERAPEVVTLGDQQVCAVYYGDSVAKPMRLACFALADGRRQWDIETAGRSLRMLQVIGPVLVIGSVGGLRARALDTGELRWTFGK